LTIFLYYYKFEIDLTNEDIEIENIIEEIRIINRE
tara:strand:+ start:2101 stop:2205 length:105 start_codon:yes stop_codon:yes gene_type:complete